MAAEPTPRGPGRPRTRPVKEERRLILRAAVDAFARDGFAGASVETIARSAGVNRANVYEHFGSKRGLIHAVVEHAGDRMTTLLVEGWTGRSDEDWREVVRASFEAVLRLVTNHPAVVRVVLLADRLDATTEDTRQRVLAQLAEASRQRLRQAGIQVDAGADVVAVMLYGMAEAVALQLRDEPWDPDAVLEVLTQFTIGGLAELGQQDFRPLRNVDDRE